MFLKGFEMRQITKIIFSYFIPPLNFIPSFLQLSRMQNNLHDPDESMAVTSVSYPNSAAANQSGIKVLKTFANTYTHNFDKENKTI